MFVGNQIIEENSIEMQVLKSVAKIGGWFSNEEILTLYYLVKNLPDNSRILEIGSYRGRSTNAMGHAIKNTNKILYCLDIWRDFEQLRKEDVTGHLLPPTDFGVFEDFLKEVEWFSENLRVLKGSTEQFSEFLPKKFFDLIFVDGAHDYDNVCRDISIALSNLKDDGIICGHDYYASEGVIKAVEELVFSTGKFTNHGVFKGTSIWFATAG